MALAVRAITGLATAARPATKAGPATRAALQALGEPCASEMAGSLGEAQGGPSGS